MNRNKVLGIIIVALIVVIVGMFIFLIVLAATNRDLLSDIKYVFIGVFLACFVGIFLAETFSRGKS